MPTRCPAADLIDSTFWDHLFRKRPAARFDDLDMEECGNYGMLYAVCVIFMSITFMLYF